MKSITQKETKVNYLNESHRILEQWETAYRDYLDQRAKQVKESRERKTARSKGENIEPLVDVWKAKRDNDIEAMKQWVNMVWYSWRKYNLNNDDREKTISEMTDVLREDLIQEIWEVALSPEGDVKCFDKNGKEVPLEVVAFRRMTNYCRHNNRIAIESDIDPNLQRDSIKPMHSYATDIVYNEAIRQAVKKANLTANERTVLTLWADRKWSERQIAEYVGVTKNAIHKSKQRAVNRILKAMIENGDSFDRLNVTIADIVEKLNK